MKLLIVTFIYLITSDAFAQPKDGISLGAGFIYKTNIREGNNLEDYGGKTISRTFPLASIKYKNLSIRGPSLKYKFYNKNIFQLSANLRYYGHQYRADGMYKRKRSLFGGFSARILYFLDLIYLKDLNNHSNGNLFTVSARKKIELSDSYSMTLRLSAEYEDKNYVNYYFGVEPGEATASRSQYAGKGTVNYTLTWGHMIKVTKDINLLINANEVIYGKSIKNSPTVRKNEEFILFIGLSFGF